MNILRGVLSLRFSLALCVVLVSGLVQSTAAVHAQQRTYTPLPLPELIEDLDPSKGKAVFELVAGKGETAFFKGKKTGTYGYNGNYLGPVIRVRKGEEVDITVRNQLNEPTTVHWHGLRVDGVMDGGPHYPIAAGKMRNVRFRVEQPAATLWYHPHGKTGEQVYKGLAGLFLVDDEISEALPLPKEYGVNDIPLIIQDKRFTENGKLLYKTHMMDVMRGMMGNVLVVNGVVNPRLEVDARNIRFRLVNGSNARDYTIGLSDGSGFSMIASDGGLLETPVFMHSIVLSPGERAEIVVDFSGYAKGTNIRLVGPGYDILDIVVGKRVPDETAVPQKLAALPPADASRSVKTRFFTLEQFGPRVTINRKVFSFNRVDEKIPLGATEVWEIRNEGMSHGMRGGMGHGMAHPFHIHGVQFRVLQREGHPPPAHEEGWKDTVLVYPGETVKVLATFLHKGIYVYHCHNLEHDDAGMMGTFEVQ